MTFALLDENKMPVKAVGNASIDLGFKAFLAAILQGWFPGKKKEEEASDIEFSKEDMDYLSGLESIFDEDEQKQ